MTCRIASDVPDHRVQLAMEDYLAGLAGMNDEVDPLEHKREVNQLCRCGFHIEKPTKAEPSLANMLSWQQIVAIE